MASETQRLLTAADYFLRRRSFADCSKYAARALDADPTNLEATRILSTAVVLSASKISPTQHDYYAVLNLPYFDYDASRIESTFETLTSILDPNTNRCPLSSEAFDLAVQAWSVLSNPVERAKFDGELRRFLGGRTSGSEGGTFWTMCPYCYHVYEYDTIFEDCCLRCTNEKCRRVLHAVAMGAPPPPDVVQKGQYCCPGFMPFAARGSNGEGKLWNPFAPAHCVGFQDHGNGNGGRPGNAGGNSAERKRMTRKKSVPWKSKKLLGRGIRLDGEQAHFVYGVREESCSNVDKDQSELSEPRFGGELVHEGEMEFLQGNDDVFVSLPCEFAMGNGRPMSL